VCVPAMSCIIPSHLLTWAFRESERIACDYLLLAREHKELWAGLQFAKFMLQTWVGVFASVKHPDIDAGRLKAICRELEMEAMERLGAVAVPQPVPQLGQILEKLDLLLERVEVRPVRVVGPSGRRTIGGSPESVCNPEPPEPVEP